MDIKAKTLLNKQVKQIKIKEKKIKEKKERGITEKKKIRF